MVTFTFEATGGSVGSCVARHEPIKKYTINELLLEKWNFSPIFIIHDRELAIAIPATDVAQS
jgi:hypothetical protein